MSFPARYHKTTPYIIDALIYKQHIEAQLFNALGSHSKLAL